MLSSGDTIGDNDRYVIDSVLGSGSFSTVYRAADRRLGDRFVAIKEFNPTAFPAEEQSWARETIHHEATLRAKLPSHPFLADVTDYFQVNGRDYLVMEYVPGVTLRRAWEQQPGRQFSESQALIWAEQLIAALHFLHSHEPAIVYRDLKPENVIVRPDGRLALIDFGIARLYSDNRQGDTINLGTPGYAAPEQYSSQESDERSDIYALAVLLHQLLSGMSPQEHVFSLPPLQTVRPDIRPQTAAAIQQAMEADRDKRFLSVRALAGALGVSVTGSLSSEPLPPLPVATAKKPAWARVALIVVAVVIIGAGALTALNRWSDDGGSVSTAGRATAVIAAGANPMGSDDDATPVQPQVIAAGDEADREGEGSSAAAASLGANETPEPTGTARPTDAATQTVRPTVTQAPSPTPTPTPTPQPLSYRDRPIVFDSTRFGGNTNIFIMDWNGANLRQLTNSSAIEDEADLSPDGQQIAYERQEGNNWYIYVMDVNGGNQRRLALGREPDWSPDGRYLAYESPPQEKIMLYDFNGGGVREVYSSAGASRAPSWSPDGRRIAFMSETNGYWQLFITSNDGTQTEQISFDAVDKRFPVWSPDGELLAYNSVSGAVFQIWTVRVNGDDARQLTNEGSNGRPAWSPDGQYIIFNGNRSGAWRIWRIDRDGANPQQLSTGEGGGDQRADWGAHRIEE